MSEKETKWARTWRVGCLSITIRRWTVGWMLYVEYCGYDWLRGGEEQATGEATTRKASRGGEV